MTCSPCMQQSPGGSDDQDTRNAACWWTLDVLELGHGGRCCQGFGIGAGIGSTTDGNLMTAANAVMALNDPCDLTASGATVGVFQAAWNNTSDPNMQSSLDASNNPIGTLTDDGKYGPETAAAVQNATGVQSPSPCTTYTGSWAGGGSSPTSYSAAVVAAATALDSYLAANGCTSCKAAGSPPSSSDPLSALVSTFKNAILVTPGSTSTSSATVTGSTINMSSAACQQSYGPGTIADLAAVLGGAKKSGATACTDASCNCLAGAPSPTPPAPPQPTPPTPVTPPSASSSSSSAAPLVAAAILIGLGGAAVYQAAKKRKAAHAHAGAY